MKRKFRIGAEYSNGKTDFKIWAPGKRSIEVVLFNGKDQPKEFFPLNKSAHDYFKASLTSFSPGDLYKFRINGDGDLFSDPASRFQPYGPHGPSQVIDPSNYHWSDNSWKGIDPEKAIIYEMHIGTFTPEGTWKSAAEKLEYLKNTGINVIEVMPVSEFPGTFGWGYDGVQLFAPYHGYGTTNDFKDFINKAHQHHIGVILDVVYNHLGPDGNYLGKYSDFYVTDKYKTDWGQAINYDGKNSAEVREYFKANAVFWIEEYHIDGLRLDATQNIYDESEPHILAEIHDVVKQSLPGRNHYIVTENEPQNCILVKDRNKGGYGFDAMWNDDFHHSATVALTGKNEAYYTDYLGKPQEFISALKYGFLYQGQYYKWQKKRRGRPSFELKKSNHILFMQNHDQIANSARGLRIHYLTSPAKLKAMTALMLLAPQTPMLFQGQEFASSAPFLYFADHNKELTGLVKQGRQEFLHQFRSTASPEIQSFIPDPGDPESFQKSILDHTEVEKNKWIYQLHVDLLKIRKSDPVLKEKKLDGAVLSSAAFVIRFFGKDEDRLLLINFGADLNCNPAPEPLLSPMENMEWEVLWSSENPIYKGGGTAPLDTKDNWMIPGNAAVLLKPRKQGKPNG